MKLLILDYDDLKNPYANGGQAYITHELASRLPADWQITVLTGNYTGATGKTVNGVTYRRLGIANGGYFAGILSYWFLLPFYVLFNQHKYDAVLEYLTAPFTASFVPLVCRKPLAALVAFFGSGNLAEKYKLPLDVFQKLLLPRYRKLIVMNVELKRKIEQKYPSIAVTVIPGGVDAELLKVKTKKGSYGLYIGRIDTFNKGLDLLIKAWKEIDLPLVLAGSGRDADVNTMKSLISETGQEQKITYVGRVEGKRKNELYANALLVIQPSKFETFGFTALETLAAGKPLVCFDIPGFSWIPGERAFKIKDISQKGLEDGLKMALSKRKLFAEIGRANRKFAESFDWDSIVGRYKEYMMEVGRNISQKSKVKSQKCN